MARKFDPKKYEQKHLALAMEKFGNPKVKTVDNFL